MAEPPSPSPSIRSRGSRQSSRMGGRRHNNFVPASSSPPRAASPYRDPFRSSSVERFSGSESLRSGSIHGSSRSFRSSSPPPPNTSTGTDPVWYVSDTKIWGTEIDVATFAERLTAFLNTYKLPEQTMPFYPSLMKLIRDKKRQVNSPSNDINIDAHHIYDFDPAVYQSLVKYPSEAVLVMDVTLNQYYRDHIAGDSDADFPFSFVARIYNLKGVKTMRDLGPQDVDSLVSIKGMVTRVSKIIPEMKLAYFRCMECFHSVHVKPHKGRITEPNRCTNCRQALTYMLQHNLSEFENKQIVKVQEAPESVPEGETPSSITMTVFDNLVDFVLPGDRVVITGIFKCAGVRTKSTAQSLKAVYKTYLDAIHISKVGTGKISATGDDSGRDEFRSAFEEGQPREGEEDSAITEADEEALQSLAQRPDIYNLLTKSLAPSIFSMLDVKKGLLAQLFGGANKQWERSRVRGEINVLLCGDPGVAKSQLLSFVHKIAPRGIYTSGKGSSSVGLTAYVVRDADSGELVLESGALVLSDKGICCIDEFDKMSDATKSVLHEVMEQQTVSIAKAGIIATLNARTSLLAAANPVESKWNKDLTVVENLKLEPTLISRFDLIYVLIDQVDQKVDTYLANHIIRLYQTHEEDKGEREHAEGSAQSSTIMYAGEEIIPLNVLTKYITYARKKVNPNIGEDARSDLVNNYVEMRKQRGRGEHSVAATTRQLESLIRLSEALAKMRLSNTIERVDVQEAYRLMTDSLRQSATNPRTGRMEIDQLFGGVDSSLGNSESLAMKLLEYLQSRQMPRAVNIGKLRQDFLQCGDMSRDIPRWQFVEVLKLLMNMGHVRSINASDGSVILNTE